MNEGLLKNIPLFASLDPVSISELAGLLKKKSYEQHQPIFWMNEKGDHLFIIIKGSVQISYTDEDGREIILDTLAEGDFFGELSLIDGGPHTATARTAEQCTLLTLDRNAFYQFLNQNPKVAFTLLEVLSLRLRNSTFRMRGVENVNEQLDTGHSRFQRIIDNLARILTSSTFVSIYIIFILGWIAAQVYLYKNSYHVHVNFLDTPPEFSILSFLLTLTSFVLTVLILNSQRRQAENDRIRGEIEYQVNLKSQSEISKLQFRMNKLVEMIEELKKDKLKDL